MKSSPTSNWIVDVALAAAFIAAFLLDQTGLELHQWIGVCIAAVSAYHLVTHWDWLLAVTRSFFAGKTSPRSSLYYGIDALILAEFFTIGLTGLLISTWLNLAESSLGVLSVVHEWVSYLTLALMAVKITLHWHWIVMVGKKVFQGQAAIPARPAAVSDLAGAPLNPSRREFLKLMGTAALASIALVGVTSKTVDVLADTQSLTTSAQPKGGSTTTGAVTVTTNSSSTGLVCARPCDRRCSFPGECRRYVDTNGNGKCDNGECT